MIWQKKAVTAVIWLYIQISLDIIAINIVTNLLQITENILNLQSAERLLCPESNPTIVKTTISNSRDINEVSEALRLRLVIKLGSEIIPIRYVAKFGEG